jgi:hypothetical protein
LHLNAQFDLDRTKNDGIGANTGILIPNEFYSFSKNQKTEWRQQLQSE